MFLAPLIRFLLFKITKFSISEYGLVFLILRMDHYESINENRSNNSIQRFFVRDNYSIVSWFIFRWED